MSADGTLWVQGGGHSSHGQWESGLIPKVMLFLVLRNLGVLRERRVTKAIVAFKKSHSLSQM